MAAEGLSDKELLKLFYLSGGNDFKAFKEAQLKRPSSRQSAASTSPVASPSAASTPAAHKKKGHPAAAAPANTTPTATKKPKPESTNKAPPATKRKDSTPSTGGDKDTTTPTIKRETKAATSPTNQSMDNTQNTPTTFIPSGNDAASQEYISFLKQQQDLQKCHQKLEEILATFERDRRTHQADLGKIRRQANDLLGNVEEGTNWNLSSKYNVNILIKDAKLKLSPPELYQPTTKPHYLDIVQQAGNLSKLVADHSNRETFPAFKSLFEHGSRRIERIETELKNSQLDATEVARLPDPLLIQLDHVLAAPTIIEVLQDNEETLEEKLFKLEDTKRQRAEALSDGEMSLAEKHYYDVVAIYESILEIVLEKLETTDEIKKKDAVFDKVREQYQTQANMEGAKLKDQKEKLKQRCEADLKKIFALKEKVDAVELATAKKLQDQRTQSDLFLADNAKSVEEVWCKIDALEKELEGLEKDRYREVKKRVHDKENDEHRRMEYEAFCKVIEEHSTLLDLTIRNCDTFIYTTTLLGEFVDTGFKTLGDHLRKTDQSHSTLLLETHRQHLEMFRGLYLGLGELVHKKEKKIEDIDQLIKNSHIQQELAMETFNPEAKKYSDSKKQLLRQRDDVEQQVNELKEKAQFALNNFKISEDALHQAGVEFVHPVVEQQEEALEMKAKMVEFKAISIGHVDALPIKHELEGIKKQMAETKKIVENVNTAAMSSSSSLPLLRAKTPPQITSAGNT